MPVRIRSVKGADKELDQFIQLLKTAPDLLPDMSRQLAEETVGLIAEGFRDEKDPYGQRWKPKLRKDGRKTLSGKTSRLKKFSIVRTGKGGFTVASSVGYAGFHQHGTKHHPRRPMLPDGRGMPRTWEGPLSEVITETLERHFSQPAGGGSSWLQHKLIGFKRRISPEALLRKAVKAIASE